jgi:hypothetical protein
MAVERVVVKTYGADRIYVDVDDDLGEICAVHEEQCTSENNYNIYRARMLDRWLNFTVTRHKAMMTQGNLCLNETENQIREQTKREQERRTIHPLPERIFVLVS